MSLYVILTEVCLAKSSFENLISIKSYQGKTFGGMTPLRSGKVKIIKLITIITLITKILSYTQHDSKVGNTC